MNRPVLTIAIPTYNRAQLLNLCLESIFNQIADYTDEIEVLISNNASTDHTKEVVQAFCRQYQQLRYSENETNGGPDFNIAKCFELAKAKYVWVFSDDDMLLPDALHHIVTALKNQDLGILFLKPSFYRSSVDEFQQEKFPFAIEFYTDPLKLIGEEHFWLTYISSIITNKDLVKDVSTLYYYQESFLIQLGWILPAIFRAKQNARITTPLILGRALAVLDFKLFHVFGRSYPRVLTDMASKGLIPVEAKNLLIELIIEKYFPSYVTNSTYHHGEQPFMILSKSFWRNKGFWTVLMPLFLRREFHVMTDSLRPTIKRVLGRNKTQ